MNRQIEIFTGKEVICIDPRYFRPTEVDILIGNPAKANEKLGWKPKTTFKELVKIMVNSDFEKAKRRMNRNTLFIVDMRQFVMKGDWVRGEWEKLICR